MTDSQNNAQNSLDEGQTHEAPLHIIDAAESAPEVNQKIYLKSPFRETHVEMQVTEVKEEKNPATGENEMAYTFHDGSKLFQSDLDGANYSWTPVPAVAASIDAVPRQDESEK